MTVPRMPEVEGNGEMASIGIIPVPVRVVIAVIAMPMAPVAEPVSITCVSVIVVIGIVVISEPMAGIPIGGSIILIIIGIAVHAINKPIFISLFVIIGISIRPVVFDAVRSRISVCYPMYPLGVLQLCIAGAEYKGCDQCN